MTSTSTSHDSTTTAAAAWPAEDYVADCNANKLAKHTIMHGSKDADYSHRKRSDENTAFWDRVHSEADRIASWGIQGLAITGPAVKADKAAAWPTEHIALGCNPSSMVSLMIHQGADNADYKDAKRSAKDEAFWDRVHNESDRIARWIVDGLAITGTAVKTDHAG